MIYLDVQDILTTYIENLLNSGDDEDKSLFHLGYYNMKTPNEFIFTERIGSKFVNTTFVPCMLEGWNGDWDPLPGVQYIEIEIQLTVMIKIDSNRDRVIYDLNRFAKELIGKYDELQITDTVTQETSTVYLALGAGVPRPIGSPMVWAGGRYLRMMLPIDISFSMNMYMGNIVHNYLDGVKLAPVHRDYTRDNEVYPVQLLTSADFTAKQTKKNANKENVWTANLTFVWNDDTDFIVNYLSSTNYNQNRKFLHKLVLKSEVYHRYVNITSSNFDPRVGKGSVMTVTIMEAFGSPVMFNVRMTGGAPITLTYNGNEITSSSIDISLAASTELEAEAPIRAGFNFVGWTDQGGIIETDRVLTITNLQENIDVIATYTPV